MKFYALTYVSFDKNKGFATSLQSNLLLFSDKYDIIAATKQAQKESIVRHLTETLGKPIQTQETIPTCNTAIYNTCITAGDAVHLLIINTVEAIPKSSNEDLDLGDFVTLKPEAVEAIRTMENVSNYRGVPSTLKIAKVIKKNAETIEVLICAIKTPNLTSTDCMAQRHTVPKDFLKKVYI